MFTSAVKKGEIKFYKVTLSGVLRFDTVTQMSTSLIVSLLMDQNALHLYKVAKLISFLIITNPIWALIGQCTRHAYDWTV